MNYKGFYLVRKWPYHVLNYLNNINMLEFREALFGKGRLGGILQINAVTILRLLITQANKRDLFNRGPERKAGGFKARWQTNHRKSFIP